MAERHKVKIKVLGAGGNAGIGMVRCLQKAFDVVGQDDGYYSKYLMECPEGEGDLTIVVPSVLLADADDKSFVPSKKQILIGRDKYKTATLLKDLAPETYWVRDIEGSGGKGAQMCQEYLGGRNFSVELGYVDGTLIAYFTKERLSYSDKIHDDPLERKGTSLASVCIKDDDLLNRAMDAVKIIADYTGTKPHGFYGVDFMEDKYGVPKITEINIGRLLTASYVYFYSTDYNLPLATISAFLGLPYYLGDYPEGIGVVRSIDKMPYVGKL